MAFTLVVLILASFLPGFAAVLRLAVGGMLLIAVFAASAGAVGDAVWALCAAAVGRAGIGMRKAVLAAT